MTTNARKISQDGLNLIKGFEGYWPTPYYCQAGVLSIGNGHAIRPGEKLTYLSIEQASELLDVDCDIAENAINRRVTVELDQNEFDALVSLVYNIGISAFATSTLLKLLNNGDYEDAANQFLVWNKIRDKNNNLVVSDGLTKRREKERALFLS